MNPFKRLWIQWKRVYLIIQYWLTGLEEGYYYTMRAHYCFELGDYQGAVRNCKTALKHSNHTFIHSTLAKSYAQLRINNDSTDYHQSVDLDIESPTTALYLANEEFKLGNIEASMQIVNKVKASGQKLSARDIEKLDYLEESIAMAEKGREELMKYKKT